MKFYAGQPVWAIFTHFDGKWRPATVVKIVHEVRTVDPWSENMETLPVAYEVHVPGTYVFHKGLPYGPIWISEEHQLRPRNEGQHETGELIDVHALIRPLKENADA